MRLCIWLIVCAWMKIELAASCMLRKLSTDSATRAALERLQKGRGGKFCILEEAA